MYSRKVEHVYQLVLRTIEFLTQQKQQKSANGSKVNSGDADISGGEVGHTILLREAPTTAQYLHELLI